MVDYRGLPQTDNRRQEVITWEVQQDNVMHGFGGYFDCTLYGKEMISIVPSTHSPGMISWFPVFIPIKVFELLQKYVSLYNICMPILNPFNVYRHLFVCTKVKQ